VFRSNDYRSSPWPSSAQSDSTGKTEEYKAGDAFVIPRGLNGVWETVEPVKKFYAIHQPQG